MPKLKDGPYTIKTGYVYSNNITAIREMPYLKAMPDDTNLDECRRHLDNLRGYHKSFKIYKITVNVEEVG